MQSATKTFFIWTALLTVILVALIWQTDAPPPLTRFATDEEASELINSGEVVGFSSIGPHLTLQLNNGERRALRPPFAKVHQMLTEAAIPYEAPETSSFFDEAAWYFLLIAGAVVAVIYLIRRRMHGAATTYMELRKSKARDIDSADKARFADIGGNREAIEHLADVVDFLRAPERWTAAGLRVPRGILIVGPPGTGKTLLARAVAGETNAAFFYVSATEFVELFVGVGAARVRDTFEKAASRQPAVIFIDELDAIGRRRGSGVGTLHEEREQTLNQLLVLLDGMERRKRLVVMAATNRPDVLDAALLRPGRFDRTFRLELPTSKERLEILTLHVRNKALDETVSLERIADQTEGYSGADLEALTNGAGIAALRRSRRDGNGSSHSVAIASQDFERARDEMRPANHRFNRLDSLLVESASQLAEPTRRTVARMTLREGTVLEGEVHWMDASHIKLRLEDGSEVVVVKENIAHIVAIDAAPVSADDFAPDPWAGRDLEVG